MAAKPHPQEQYFQESPFLIHQGIPGKTGPQEKGEQDFLLEIFTFWPPYVNNSYIFDYTC